MPVFSGKTLLITGGTGSFGQAVVKRLLDTDVGEIRVFSRDEKKQSDLQRRYCSTKLRFYLGDIRDMESIENAMKGVDGVFHAAALKQVPSCESFPMEAVRTNILGTGNVLNAAVKAGVRQVVCLSTDKAAYPASVMGISKAMMEKIAMAKARESKETIICCTRFGNVIYSRGSVVPLFMEQIRQGKPITLTNPHMTRFLMDLEEAVDLVLFALEQASPGDLFIHKASTATMGDLAAAVQQVFGNTGTRIIGLRRGEKRHETLMTAEEAGRAEDMGNYFRIPAEESGLSNNWPFAGEDSGSDMNGAYTSQNAPRLDVDGIIGKLRVARELSTALGNFSE